MNSHLDNTIPPPVQGAHTTTQGKQVHLPLSPAHQLRMPQSSSYLPWGLLLPFQANDNNLVSPKDVKRVEMHSVSCSTPLEDS